MSFHPIYKIKDSFPPITEKNYNLLPVAKNGYYGFYKLKYKPVVFNKHYPGAIPHTYWDLEYICTSDFKIIDKDINFVANIFDTHIENDEFYYLDEYLDLRQALVRLDEEDTTIHHSGEYDKVFYRMSSIGKYISYNERSLDDIENLNIDPKDLLLEELAKVDNYKLSKIFKKMSFNEYYKSIALIENNDIDYYFSNNINSIEFYESNPDCLQSYFKYNNSYFIHFLKDIDFKDNPLDNLLDLLRNPNAGNIISELIPDIYNNQEKYNKKSNDNLFYNYKKFFNYTLYNLSQNPNCIEILNNCKFNTLSNISVNQFINWELFLKQNQVKNFLYLKHLIDIGDTKDCFPIQCIGNMKKFMSYLYNDDIDEESIFNFRNEYNGFLNKNGYQNPFPYNFNKFWGVIAKSEIGFKMFESIIREISIHFSEETGHSKYMFCSLEIEMNPAALDYLKESFNDPEFSEECLKMRIENQNNVFLINTPNVQIFKIYYDFYTPKKITINDVVKYCFLNIKNKWCNEKVKFLEYLIEDIVKSEEYNKDPFDFWQTLFKFDFSNLLPFLNKYRNKIIPEIDRFMTIFYTRSHKHISNFDLGWHIKDEINSSLFIDFIESNWYEIFNQDNLIPLYAVYSNKYIYKLDKIKMMNQCKDFAEELTAYVFNPTRLQRFSNMYLLPFDILLELY